MFDYRYVHFITSIESGGAQKALYNFLVEQDESIRHRSAVFYFVKSDFYKEKFREIGVDVFYAFDKGLFLEALRLVRSKNNTLISWMYHACLFTILGIGVKKRVVWTIHHGKLDFKTDSLSTSIAFFLCAIFSRFLPMKVVYVSKACRNDHFRFGFSKSNGIVIYNCVDYEALGSIERSKEFDVIFVGRAHPNKNLPLFLRFCEKLVVDKPSCSIIVIGDGTEVFSNSLDPRVRKNIKFLGEVDDVSYYFLRSNTYVCTSKVESFGLTIVEAIAAGCKVVCPDRPIFREIAQDCASYYSVERPESVLAAYFEAEPQRHASVVANLSRFSKQATFEVLSDIVNEEFC